MCYLKIYVSFCFMALFSLIYVNSRKSYSPFVKTLKTKYARPQSNADEGR